ncbi:MAG: tRNA (uridine(34)/cytosine(34)/5-carboxymethylaminomethyluridine(34)-2'-O)-methyltransferase TrmL [Oscillospiraceae bacterium]|nr:tRNA (uridine(34)/cytosine(34)/5-carboxymethylaminomethyluridine(34)-2'-O)-methyltransferase TrmL [Oscillospiraceae bacterium]
MLKKLLQNNKKCHKIIGKAIFVSEGVEALFNIVLVEPEIPSNTGNISRTCAVTGASLHLIHPLGFDISDKQVKRAGLDYWEYLDIHEYKNLEDFFEKNRDGRFFFCSTKAKNVYTENEYRDGDFFIFGKETRGLPEELLAAHPDECIRIPMLPTLRSLNLSNSVAIVAYEALRQTGFQNMQLEGKLTNLALEGAE